MEFRGERGLEGGEGILEGLVLGSEAVELRGKGLFILN